MSIVQREITKDNIMVQKTVLQSLIKFCENSLNNHSEGLIFGYSDKSSVFVENAIPFEFSNPNIAIVEGENKEDAFIHQYYEKNRMDHLKIGHFICTDHSEFISKKYFKHFVEFQKKQPNSIVIFLDHNLYKLKQYSFQCFRITPEFIKTIRRLDIEEDETNFFKKFHTSKLLLDELHLNIRVQAPCMLSNLTTKGDKKQSEDAINFDFNEENGYLYRRLSELNKMSDKYIEEQKKYINHYKTSKKIDTNSLDNFNKKNDQAKFDKLDITLLTKNIQNLNDHIKTVTSDLNCKNMFVEQL